MEKSTQSLFGNACKNAVYQNNKDLEEKIWNHLCNRSTRIHRFKIIGFSLAGATAITAILLNSQIIIEGIFE